MLPQGFEKFYFIHMYIYLIMIYMIRLVAIGEASQVLGVSIATLRRWEAAGKLIPERTLAGHRRYDLAKLKPELFHTGHIRAAYGRLCTGFQPRPEERSGTAEAGVGNCIVCAKAGPSQWSPTLAPA